MGAREELGFEPNHPHDTDVCRKFEKYMCDPLFDGIDIMTETLAKDPKFEPVAYNPVVYELDPELSFEDLPVREAFEKQKPGQKDKEFAQMQTEIHALEKTFEIVQLFADLSMQVIEAVCANAEAFTIGIAFTIKAPWSIACDTILTVSANVWLFVLPTLQIPTIVKNHKYEVDTLGDGQVWDTWVHAKETAKHLEIFERWSIKALGTINKNIHDQHKEIRAQLQNRHTLMENHINQVSTKYTNHLGDYIEKVAGMIYSHHDMMFNKIGAIVQDQTGVLEEKTSLPNEEFVPAPLSPSEAPPDNSNESSSENSSSAQDIQLNQWNLPPQLDVEWPKGHSSLWELISNEVGDYVEEVGISVLTALGADVVARRRLAGTSERHFELDVKWPTGGSHVLDEVKNHHSEKVDRLEAKIVSQVVGVEDKVVGVEEKVVGVEEKVDRLEAKMEAKMTKIENMIEKLLEKLA